MMRPRYVWVDANLNTLDSAPGVAMDTKTIIENDMSGTMVHDVAELEPVPSWRTWLIGRPLATADAPHQTVNKLVGLAIFASDALSSTAYATQEMLVILAAAGSMAFGFAFPISIAIVLLWSSSPSRTNRRSTRTRAAAAPTSCPATTWASCRRKSPVPHCSRTTF